MKKLFVTLLLSFPIVGFAEADNNVVEIDVQGMTCPFCVDGLHASLVKLPGIAQAEVSLKNSRVRLELEPGQVPDLATIRKAIIDAGFTPGELREGT